MHYVGNIIRPPSEANSIILQVAVGCSHNKCTFCGAYKGTPFTLKDIDIILEDISFASKYCKNQKRVFLADGDALVLPQNFLLEIFNAIRIKLPWVRRISLYATGKAINSKTLPELQELKRLGLDRIYLGVESGHLPTLKAIKKSETPESFIRAANIVNKAGVFLSITVLLGIGGASCSIDHAKDTALLLNIMKPKQIAALTLMLLPNTPLYDKVAEGSFSLIDKSKILLELKEMLVHIDLNKVQFYSNHASNYLQLSGRLPKDKGAMLKQIQQVLTGEVPYLSEKFRAL